MAQIGKGQGAAPRVLTVGSPSIGEILAERYQIEAHIGDDSLGRQLYQGVDVVLRRPVTVVLRYPGGESAGEMLAAAVAASRVVHPHLIGVYDAIDEGERAYVVREWVEGVSLREAVVGGPLDAFRAVAISWAVADAVAALHATGVVHGNIHPNSIMIAQDGRVVLADARAVDADTPAADIRAIGGVLYYALTGFWPHAEAGPAPVADGVREGASGLVPPRQVRGGVPAHLDELCMAVLDKGVVPPTAEALAGELAQLGQSEEPPLDDDGDAGFNLAAFDGTPAVEPARPSRQKIAMGVSALLALALVGTFAATQFANGGNADGAAGGQPHVTNPASKPPSGQPRALVLTANQVRIIDSPGGDRAELKYAERTVDHNPNTGWKTAKYNDNPNFGGFKQGMGVWLDLGSTQRVFNVKVDMSKAGATAELRGGDSDPGSSAQGDAAVIGTYKVLDGPKVNTGTTVLFVGNDQPVRYLLVWITGLPQVSTNRYQLEVEEITVSVR